MQTEYKSNSHKSRDAVDLPFDEDKKEIKKVTRGNVKVKKEPIKRKFADTFLSENADNVKTYLFWDVLVPAIKDTLDELVSNGAHMLIYGSSGGPRRSKSGSKTSYTSYYRGSNSNDREERRRPSRESRYGYDEIIFESRGDALEVKDCLEEILDKYHIVSIADFYELSGHGDESSYTDNKYGWYEFDNGLSITRDRDGYHLRLPKPVAFD